MKFTNGSHLYRDTFLQKYPIKGQGSLEQSQNVKVLPFGTTLQFGTVCVQNLLDQPRAKHPSERRPSSSPRAPIATRANHPPYQRIREEKRTQTQTLGPDIFRWGGGLPREGVGAKKFGTSLETREIKLFRWDIPDFAGISRRPEKFEKKSLCSIFGNQRNDTTFANPQANFHNTTTHPIYRRES